MLRLFFINNLRRKYSRLEIPDVTNEIFLIILSIISLAFLDEYPDRFLIPIVNFVLIILITFIVNKYESKPDSEKRKPSLSRLLRFWYPVVMIFFCFKEIYVLMLGLRPGVLMDDVLINIDHALFGFHPTVEIAGIASPLLTEFFQLIYSLFYFMPIIFALELYLWHRYEEMKYAMFIILFGFYLSFIGYLLVPAIGPRFTLHDFHSLDMELPGLYISQFVRGVINFVESIPPGVSNPQDYAQRDAFPSGHTIIIMLIAYLSWRIKSNSFYFYFPFAILMIFSTVYLRYHYVIDLAGGIPVVVITILLANYLFKKKEIYNELR